MRRSTFADLELSQLMLGTVQFGMAYGIANRSGQPTYETARDILAAAYEGGVNCLDTAVSYGSSEEVVGRALRELGLREQFVIVSKVPPVPPGLSPKHVDEFVERSVLQSLQRLQIGVLPVCLFHQECDSRYLESLFKVKQKGLVQHAGVSGLTPGGTLAAVTSGQCEAVQLPASALDRSFIAAGVFSAAQRHGAAVFVRSVFLQGLMLMRDDEILPELAVVRPALARLRTLAREANLTMSELAVRYVLSLSGMTCILTGVESVAQICENIRLIKAGPLPLDLRLAVETAIPKLPESITSPSLWSNQRSRKTRLRELGIAKTDMTKPAWQPPAKAHI